MPDKAKLHRNMSNRRNLKSPMSLGGIYLVNTETLVDRYVYRLWTHLTAAILEKNMERAQEAKSAVEDAQREERRRRDELGLIHSTRFFEQDPSGRWVPKVR